MLYSRDACEVARVGDSALTERLHGLRFARGGRVVHQKVGNELDLFVRGVRDVRVRPDQRIGCSSSLVEDALINVTKASVNYNCYRLSEFF